MTFLKSPRRAHILFALILALTIATRFVGLGTRTMSHDETQHTYFSWLFYRGSGYTHTPLTHGPLQFHLMALSYGIFGDTDTAARIPHATFAVLTVAALWLLRRYLGSRGTLFAAALMLISPYLLYYGRYARNEALVGFFAMLTWWSILRYLESGQKRYLLVLSAATALHFATKETAFIYTAQALLFLGGLFLWRSIQQRWVPESQQRTFYVVLLGAGISLLLGVGFFLPGGLSSLSLLLLGLAVLLGAAALFLIGQNLDWPTLRQERTFSLMLLLLTLVLPHLSAFVIRAFGFDPMDISSSGMMHNVLVVAPLVIIAALLGSWWNAGLWTAAAALFYGIYALFYTSVFTYAPGLLTGLVQPLGYWLSQQGVQRGGQPWYYYLVVQIPVYEYLPLLASLLAVFYLLRAGRRASPNQDKTPSHLPANLPAVFFLYWSITAIIAYSIAGEKMPWLTYHITLPMTVLGGWALGKLSQRFTWREVRQGWPILTLLLLAALALTFSLPVLTHPASTPAVQMTGAFSSLLFVLVCLWALWRQLPAWQPVQVVRLLLAAFFALLFVLTARSAYTAAYLNAEYPTEFLVYAHSAPANKRLYHELQDLSYRLYGDLSIKVAYDNSDGKGDPGAAWPLSWYLRNFPNTLGFGPSAPSDLRTYDVVVVSDSNWAGIDPLLRGQYNVFEVNRMWWPMQDYFNLTWERIRNALSSPEMRAALFQIWLNRDYDAYGKLTGQELHPPVWNPTRKMRVYIRKDIPARLWEAANAPTAAAPSPQVEVSYEEGRISNPPQKVITHPEMVNPRGIAVAPDGSLYVSDISAQRIFHFDTQGSLLESWGTYGSSEASPAPPGTFNEPWGLAVAPDGSVYVADTWNHRIQKFSADGQFLTMWGYFGQAESPQAFWGPRAVAVDSQGNVFVSDTGNKRIVIFDANGAPLSQTTAGLNEQVGIALNAQGQLFVSDTWNQRVVMFDTAVEGIYTPANEWPVQGWYSDSLDNKPYIAVLPDGRIAVTDPEGYRVLLFSADGDFLHTWGDEADISIGLGLPIGIAADAQGGLWVADAATGRVLYFTLP